MRKEIEAKMCTFVVRLFADKCQCAFAIHGLFTILRGVLRRILLSLHFASHEIFRIFGKFGQILHLWSFYRPYCDNGEAEWWPLCSRNSSSRKSLAWCCRHLQQLCRKTTSVVESVVHYYSDTKSFHDILLLVLTRIPWELVTKNKNRSGFLTGYPLEINWV